MFVQTHRIHLLTVAIGLLHGLGLALPAAENAGEFAELSAAIQPLQTLVADNTIRAFAGAAPNAPAPQFLAPQLCLPLPTAAAIRAYEEHRQFVYAVGDVACGPGQPPAETAAKGPRFVRRVIGLKPGLFLVDDLVTNAGADLSLRWAIRFRGEPKPVGRQWRLAEGGQELVCEMVWPADKTLQRVAPTVAAGEAAPWFESTQPAAAGGARWVHVFQVRPAAGAPEAAKVAAEAQDGRLEVTIAAAEKTIRLTLPPPGADAGWIAAQDDGKPVLPRRPLASGILPHGPEGMRMLERWDSAYRDGRVPGWDTGAPAPELKRVVEAGLVKPCRVVSLGCGSGASDIYLASKGFDVTAIDVAPTALGLAQQKAEQAGVRVRWVLADVLMLPDLGQFDFIYDRGCYHHVRYVDAAGATELFRRLSHPGTRALILSCDNDAPPGVREHHMRSDFSALFDFEWLRDSGVENRDGTLRRQSWSLMLRRKDL